MNIISNLAGSVTLSLLSSTIQKIGSDGFVLMIHTVVVASVILVVIVTFRKIFIDKTVSLAPASSSKMILANALANVITYILVVYSCPPSRTPLYLQNILFLTILPFTFLCRLFFLRQG
jgi:hypothetical protein